MNIISMGLYSPLQQYSNNKNPITKRASTLLWSWLLQNLSCTYSVHEKHPGETQNIGKHEIDSLNCTY